MSQLSFPQQKLNSRTTRRRFIATTGKAGIAAWALAGSINIIGSQRAKAAIASPAPDDLIFTSAKRMAEMIKAKKVSAVELLDAHFKRIDAVNPKLNAIVMFCRERAYKEAKDADDALAKGQIKGPLHGVPFTIKDSIDTAGVVTTGATMGRKNYVPGKDATTVARLRDAGGILVGKTNTPEFTLSGITDNLIYGRTYNAYKLTHSVGGSSGGAGAIISAGGAPFDIGTDFGGSIRGPAHFNGITGIKPNSFRVPRTGHIVDYGGFFDGYQQLGPMARWVEDLIYLMPIISGPDYIDAGIIPMPLGDPEAVDIKKLRFVYYTDNGSTVACTPETKAAVMKAVDFFKSMGASVVEDSPIELFKESEEVRRQVRVADGLAWVKRHVDKHGTKQTSRNLALDGGAGVDAGEFTALAEKLDSCRSRFEQWMVPYDVILCPTNPEPAKEYSEQLYQGAGLGAIGYTGTYNMTGWPGSVVRAGSSPDGLPIGVQIVTKAWREDVSLAVAAALESATGGWQKPAI